MLPTAQPRPPAVSRAPATAVTVPRQAVVVNLADRVAHAYVDAVVMHARSAPYRFADVIAGLPVTSLRLPERWGSTVFALDGAPDPAAVAAGLAVLRRHTPDPTVTVRQRYVDALPDFRVRGELPALARAIDDASLAVPHSVRPATRDEFASAYRGGFGMRPGLAEALTAPEDVADPRFVHLAAEDAGAVIGCGLLRVTSGGVGYVSAVGVLPDRRGRGYGGALVTAAMRTAAERGCDLAVLHSAHPGALLSRRLGFEMVDTHVELAPEAIR